MIKMVTKNIVVFITGCFFLVGCENDPAEIKKISTKKLGIEEAKNVKVNYTSGGKTKAILTSPLMLRVQDTMPYLEFPNTLEVDFYNDAGQKESKLTAHYAKYKENQNIVFLKDSVKVTNTKGETLYCNELYWDRNRTGNEFYTDKPVRIRTNTHIIDGIGIEASQDFKYRRILEPRGIVKVSSSELPQ
ncbi:MAG TPA: LPS export ABC transporter periplasmic protein LptC [Ferruginibacter sp.]|nr:LPS export ABC transporter periplasmic protein LptC [Ferruginibacter sp.]